MHHVRRYYGEYSQRARDYWGGFRGSDPVLQIFSAFAFLILLAITAPGLIGRIVPQAADGSDCAELPPPPVSSNFQSVLASQVDPSMLHLEVAPESYNINQGQPLVIKVRFINESMAPLTLYLVPDDAILRYTNQDTGLMLVVQNAAAGAQSPQLAEPPSLKPSWTEPDQYASDQLHVLSPRQRCYTKITLPPARLNSAGIVQGQYRISAVYINQKKGTLVGVEPRTPTPVFHDQGVWTGNVQSNTVVITIGLPTQPPPS